MFFAINYGHFLVIARLFYTPIKVGHGRGTKFLRCCRANTVIKLRFNINGFSFLSILWFSQWMVVVKASS